MVKNQSRPAVYKEPPMCTITTIVTISQHITTITSPQHQKNNITRARTKKKRVKKQSNKIEKKKEGEKEKQRESRMAGMHQ